MIRQFLEIEFGRRKSKNPSYSMRGFAKSLGVSPSYVSKILRNQVCVSRDSAKKMLSRISVEGMDRLTIPRDMLSIAEMRQISLSLSYHETLVGLVVSKSQSISVEQVARVLGLTSEAVSKVVKSLVGEGVIEEIDGILRTAEDKTAIVQFLKERSQKLEFLDRLLSTWKYQMQSNDSDVFNLNLSIAIDENSKGMIKQELLDLQKRLNDAAGDFSGPVRVHNICIGLFPASEEFNADRQ